MRSWQLIVRLLFASTFASLAFVTVGANSTSAAGHLPTPLRVSVVRVKETSSSVTLTWNNPRAGTYTGVLVRRAVGKKAPSSISSGTLAAKVGAPTRAFEDTSVRPNTTYSYSLFAFDGSSYSGPVTIRTTTETANPDSTPPANALSGVVQVSSGGDVACALLEDGTVDCWGNASLGQLGNATSSIENPIPSPVEGLSHVKQISVGALQSCALLDDGTVVCWGLVYSPTLNPNVGDSAPVPVVGLTGVSQIGAGANFTCALMIDQTVECWGENTYDTLGSGAPTASTTPEPVPNLQGVTQLAVGEFNTCALITGGTVKCWGANGSGGLGNGTSGELYSGVVSVEGITNATQVSTGNGTSCAVLIGGKVKCWGSNITGQLDVPGSKGNSSTPVSAAGLTGVSDVSVGQVNACALLIKGTVECWGESDLQGTYYGGPSQLSYSPYVSRVAGLANVTELSTAIALGVAQYSCALLRSKMVRCWGSNYDGELGDGLTGNVITPSRVVGLASVSQISAGADHTCALLDSGSIDCWGLGMFGELGRGVSSDSARPIAVPGVSGATHVAAGQFDTCALLGSGAVKCWGLNSQGELGDGQTSAASSNTGPVLVKGLSSARQISVGWTHACALLSSGSVECWGDGSHGQLGNGSDKQSDTPVVVAGLSNVRQIEAGDEDSCALLNDGTVECWGNGSSGQLGNGTYADSPVPVAVQGLSGVTQISLGDSFACALLSTGSVECWGNDFEDQLGNFDAAGAGEADSTPVVVAQITNATSVALGGQTSCAITATPELTCWGYSGFFQYPSSDGIVGNWAPTTVSGVSGVTQVSVGEYHVCALLDTGLVECWGDNYDGQDGNGVLGYSAKLTWVVS